MTDHRTLPPTFFMAAAALSVAAHVLSPWITLVRYPINLLGVIPIVTGAVLNLWADQIFKRAGTTVKPFEKPTAFLVSGPFRVFRHPMYAGMLMVLAGISILCGSVVSFIGPMGFWIIIRRRFIPPEEAALLEAFGDEYRHYRARVSAWM